MKSWSRFSLYLWSASRNVFFGVHGADCGDPCAPLQEEGCVDVMHLVPQVYVHRTNETIVGVPQCPPTQGRHRESSSSSRVTGHGGNRDIRRLLNASQERVEEQIAAVPVPQIKKGIVEVTLHVPQERVQNRTDFVLPQRLLGLAKKKSSAPGTCSL